MVGYTKHYRKELVSDIWSMPPLYHRVWTWLRHKAKYKTEEFPTAKGFGIWLRPGQLLLSYDLIAQGISWIEYGVEKKPNKKTIKVIMEWLVFNEMIQVESNAHGTWVKLMNWDTYNTTTPELVTQKKRGADTVKEVKEVKELKKESKHIYGSDKKVRLTQAEYDRLTEEWGERKRDAMIERLGYYIATNKKGQNYTDHNRVMRGWDNKDKENQQPPIHPGHDRPPL